MESMLRNRHICLLGKLDKQEKYVKGEPDLLGQNILEKLES